MFWRFIILLFLYSIQTSQATKDIIVENPFYLRARIHDAHTASVQFEIADETEQRNCQLYKFTIRRNQENVYTMPEQNLTYWRNFLELQHLDSGDYNICAIICSEHIRETKFHYQQYMKKNQTKPVIACVHFHASRPHLLVLTLYVLVLILLIISQIIYSLRKRQVHERIKMGLIEVEKSLQKWRAAQTPLPSTDHTQSYTTLQNVINLPASPVEHSQVPPNTDGHEQPIIFHLESLNENENEI